MCIDLFHLLFISLSLMLFVQGPQGAQGGQGPPGQLGSKVRLSDICTHALEPGHCKPKDSDFSTTSFL